MKHQLTQRIGKDRQADHRPNPALVATGMRNEGPFIVEWVCWYRMLGFEILVVTNDCTDHSPALLNALAKAGWLTHDTHKPRDGQPPQKSAHRKIMNVPVTAQADWTLICDVDEFLVLHDHDTIADYMGPPPHDFMAIAFNWKCFGTGDRDFVVTMQHPKTRCAPHQGKVCRSFARLKTTRSVWSHKIRLIMKARR